MAKKREFSLDIGKPTTKEPSVSDDAFIRGVEDPFPSESQDDSAEETPKVKKPKQKAKSSEVWTRKLLWLQEDDLEVLQAMADEEQGRRTGRGNTSTLMRDILKREIKKYQRAKKKG